MGLVTEGDKPQDALEAAAQQVCLNRTARASASRSSSLQARHLVLPRRTVHPWALTLFLDLLKPEELGGIRAVIAQGDHIPRRAVWVRMLAASNI